MPSVGNSQNGKGGKQGGWYINYKIPFGKSIRITIQAAKETWLFSCAAAGAALEFLPPAAQRRACAETRIGAPEARVGDRTGPRGVQRANKG